MSRSTFLIAAFAAVVAACSSSGTGPASDPAETTQPDASTSTITAATTTVAPTTVAPTPSGTDLPVEQSETVETFDESRLSLGPGRAFPALDDPPMVAGSAAAWLEADDIVLGLVNAGEAQAFPASQLAYHHIVNTMIAGDPFLVTY